MNDQQFFLANAYLDGELTADARALAESDPIVMAGVEELRSLQGALRDVDPPGPAGRESAIAAAMAEYSEMMRAPRTAPAPSRVVPFWRRPTARRALAFAAAVVAVGLLGVVVASQGGDDDLAGTAGDDAAEDTDENASRVATATVDDGALDQSEALELAPSVDTAGDADAIAAAPAGDDAAADVDDMATSGVIAVTEPTAPVAEADVPAPTALAELGADLLAQRIEGVLPPTPNTRCVFLDRPAEVLAETGLDTPVGLRDVLVAVDEIAATVYAIDPATCEILVTVPLP